MSETVGPQLTKNCTVCKELKPIDEFGKYSHSTSGIHYRCKQCNNSLNVVRDQTPYVTWRGMKERCTSPNHKNYNLYKDRWYPPWNDYKVFEKWALKNNWRKGLTIDRIDATLGYSESNCQFLTRSENTAKGNRERSLIKKEYYE